MLEAHLLNLGFEYLLVAELIYILDARSVAGENVVYCALADHVLDLTAAERILATKAGIFLLGISLHH